MYILLYLDFSSLLDAALCAIYTIYKISSQSLNNPISLAHTCDRTRLNSLLSFAVMLQ